MLRFLVSLAALLAVCSCFPAIPVFQRNADYVDLRAKWELKTSVGPFECPNEIVHTTWSFDDALEAAKLPHNTIDQDGKRCNSEADEKALIMYEGEQYAKDFSRINSSYPVLPKIFIKTVRESRFARRIRKNLLNTTLAFLMGYDNEERDCSSTTAFPKNTITFVARPLDVPFKIPDLPFDLACPDKYMLMVPKDVDAICVYTSDVFGDDDDRMDSFLCPSPTDPSTTPTPTASPSPSTSADPSPSATPSASATISSTPSTSVMPTLTDEPMTESAVPSATDEIVTEPPVTTGTAVASTTPEMHATPSVDVAESPDASPSPEENESVCFPGDVTVETESGLKRMEALKVGDRVRVSSSEFSTVFGFTHNTASAVGDYVTLETSKGSLTATVGHFVYVNGQAIGIEKANVGDKLSHVQGDATILSLRIERSRRGLYNPQTVHGDIMVGGFRSSTYTRTVTPTCAHALLSPLRALFAALEIDASWVVGSGLRKVARRVEGVVA